MQKTKSKRGHQLRNGDTDLQALTQWVGRKCRNHNPAEGMERGGSRSKAKVGIVADDDKNTVIYQSGGRRFHPLSVYRDWETDRKSTRLNSSHSGEARMPSSA